MVTIWRLNWLFAHVMVSCVDQLVDDLENLGEWSLDCGIASLSNSSILMLIER